MCSKYSPVKSTSSRGGFLAPAVACALLVALGCVALVLDRLWLDAAVVELTTAAEAAGLAAARELTSDDLLRVADMSTERIVQARESARQIAAKNRVAGFPVVLDSAEDLRFGTYSRLNASGPSVFLETDQEPETVRVYAGRTRSRRNPVGRFVREMLGRWDGIAIVRVDVTRDNRIAALRPIAGTPIPAYPLAILLKDAASERTDTWDARIIKGESFDLYRVDAQGDVFEEPDGIPEIVLSTRTYRAAVDDANVLLVGLGNGLRHDQVTEQFRHGVRKSDLQRLGVDEIPLCSPLDVAAQPTIDSSFIPLLKAEIGQPRIYFLYQRDKSRSVTATPRVRIVGAVAGRVVAVTFEDDDLVKMTLQPCVLTTRTAVVDDTLEHGNPHIYKLHVTSESE